MLRILLLLIFPLTIVQALWHDWPLTVTAIQQPSQFPAENILFLFGWRLALTGLALMIMVMCWVSKKITFRARIYSQLYLDIQFVLLAFSVFRGQLALPSAIDFSVGWLLELLGLTLALALFWHVNNGADKRQKSSSLAWFSLLTIMLMFIVSLFGHWLSLPGRMPAWTGTVFSDPQHLAVIFDFPFTRITEWLQGGDTPFMLLSALQLASMLIASIVILALALAAMFERNNPALRAYGLGLLIVYLSVGCFLAGSFFLKGQDALAWMYSGLQYSVFLLLPPLIGLFKNSRYQRPVRVISTAKAEVLTPEIPPETNLYTRLRTQLGRTRGGLTGWLSDFSAGDDSLDTILEQVESQLLMADVGMATSTEILEGLKQKLANQTSLDRDHLSTLLREQLSALLTPLSQPLVLSEQHKPFVILVIGVNGAGKTTTIGKLAKKFSNQGHKVMLAAGDTFRAAAVEQLQVWGERNDVPVIAQHTGADSASVIFDALQSAKNKGIDVLIADTAGRLHTKSNLMEELKKIKRIMTKLDPEAPHEVLLVLDAGIGQNGLAQAKQFHDSMNVTGLALTKLDGTAKGGVIFALASQLQLPIRLIGVGEGIDDLQDFNAEQFISALFNQES